MNKTPEEWLSSVRMPGEYDTAEHFLPLITEVQVDAQRDLKLCLQKCLTALDREATNDVSRWFQIREEARKLLL